MSQSEAPVDKEVLTIYLENVTCTENLEDAVELSSDKLRAIVTLEFPVDCEYFMMSFSCSLSLCTYKYTDVLDRCACFCGSLAQCLKPEPETVISRAWVQSSDPAE